MDEEKEPMQTVTHSELEDATVGFSAKGKRLLDPEIVKKMKEAGLPRPDEVASSSWNQLQDVKEGVHTLVAHLAACGVRAPEIAEATGLNITTVRRYLESEKMKFEIKKKQHQFFGRDPMQRFKSLVTDATDVIEETMKDPQAKPSVRVLAADKILDRAMGKPKQFLQVEGSMIRKIYESLDNSKPVIDAEPVSSLGGATEVEARPVENPNSTEKVDRSQNPNLAQEPQDKWSTWIKDNI